jgi:hypothetical protein
LQQAQIRGIDQNVAASQGGELRADLKLAPEIDLLEADAFYKRAMANKAGKEADQVGLPAAVVQSRTQLANAIMAIAPDVHTPASALIAAQQMLKPGQTKEGFITEYSTMYSLISGGAAPAAGEAEALAVELGLSPAVTVESLRGQQAEAVQAKEVQAIIEQGPDAVFDRVSSENPTATYEQVQAKVQELTGKRSTRPDPNAESLLEESEVPKVQSPATRGRAGNTLNLKPGTNTRRVR